MAALDKIFELLDEQPELIDAPDAVELPRVRGELRFDHVFRVRRLRRRRRGLRRCTDIDLDVPPGTDGRARRRDRRRQVDVRQARRALLRPDAAAAILVDGHDLRSVTARSRCAAAGDRPPGGLPVRGHARATTSRSAGPSATDAEIVAAARAVGADEFIAALDDGYDTELGERGYQLSPASASSSRSPARCVADPRILILDEATSNVDIRTESLIEQALRRLLAGRTAIVIAHRLSTIRNAGRIVVLEHGRIVEQGTHDELLEARGATGSCTATGPSRRGRLTMPAVTGLAVTAVKGTRLRQVDAVELGRDGVRENRRFYLIDDAQPDGQRQARGRAPDGDRRLLRGGARLRLEFPDGQVVDDEVRLGDQVVTKFFSRAATGQLVDGPWSEALSDFVGRPLRLVEARRRHRGRPGLGGRGVADLTSVPGAARGCAGRRLARIDVRRFRMLIEIDGVEAHAEDRWVGREVRLGDGERASSTVTSAAA